MDIHIESGVPIPPKSGIKSRSYTMYPFAELEIGESFFVPGRKPGDISASTSWARLRYPDRGFVTRSVDGGTRVWRTA